MTEDDAGVATRVERRRSDRARASESFDPDSTVRDLASGNLEARLEAQAALAQRGIQSVPALLTALAREDGHARAAIVRTLGAIRDPTVAPTLARALDDDDASVRWEAGKGLMALGRTGLQTALHVLITHQMSSPQLKAAVRHVLLGMKTEELEGILAPVLHALEHHAPDEVLMVKAYKAIVALAGEVA
jgi:HEAT repeat protein